MNSEILKVVVLLAGGYLFVSGYKATPDNEPAPAPDSVTADVVLIEMDETFPPKTTDTVTLMILHPLEEILKGQPEDALVLARAYKQWADRVESSTKIKDLAQFARFHKEAAEVLLLGTPTANKYGGRINEVIKNLYLNKLDFLKDEEGNVTSTEITPEIRRLIVQMMDDTSWKMSDIFFNNVIKEEDNEPSI